MTTDPYFLAPGSHRTAADGRCAMEFVAHLAGEPHSDKPACVSPLLRDFCIAFNDALPDDERQRLRPYLARTIGTVDDGHDKKRAWLCADWLVRVHVPTRLDLAGLTVLAARLRALPAVMSPEAFQHAEPVLTEARLQAVTARRAAWAAAQDAWDAAGAVAGATRGAAGIAARIAARAAARDAAGGAAGDAGAAAGAALRPTVAELQRSAFDLLDRMLPTEPLALPALETANPAPVPVGAR